MSSLRVMITFGLPSITTECFFTPGSVAETAVHFLRWLGSRISNFRCIIFYFIFLFHLSKLLSSAELSSFSLALLPGIKFFLFLHIVRFISVDNIRPRYSRFGFYNTNATQICNLNSITWTYIILRVLARDAFYQILTFS